MRYTPAVRDSLTRRADVAPMRRSAPIDAWRQWSVTPLHVWEHGTGSVFRGHWDRA